VDDEQSLRRAFHSFAQAAESLERSYGELQAEVGRLRRALEQSNADLAESLEENRRMRTHLDHILEGLPCGVLVVDDEGGISRANPEALRLLEMDQPGAARLGHICSLPGRVRELLERAAKTNCEQELSVREATGALRWLAARHATVANDAATSVFILRDVSERKRLEQAEARMRRDEALAEMSALLAHEIRNPLGSLELFAGLLAESALDPESRKWVEHVQAGLRTLAATVNNVLHFHGSPQPERAPVDLGQLLDWAREFFAPLARRARIEMSVRHRLAGVLLEADRHRLEQIFSNLVLNAVRAMPGGGWIELRAGLVEDGRAVAIVVTDTGPGISPEHLPRIFEAGFSTRDGSPGLGLAVCRKIVEQHGGTITASSRPGHGARFTLTFPLAGKLSGGVAA
jgi:signal transduction histidine kinase